MRGAKECVAGLLAVTLLTVVCYQLHQNFAVTGFLYLLIVVLESLAGGFPSSAIVSVFAVACLDYFFVPPVWTWEVPDSQDAVALITFLITALVITRLASQSRAQAAKTQAERTKLKRLYDVARQLLSLGPGMKLGAATLRPFREVFGLRAVCLFDAQIAELYSDGNSSQRLPERTRDAYIFDEDHDEDANGISVRCLRVAGSATGAVGFEGLRDAELTAGPLSALAAAALERTRAFQDASNAEARAQAEVLRGAILDALAHEFKTPLTTILTAAGGLAETSRPESGQREMAETIESEACRLDQLASRLLRTARLDRQEVKPSMEPTDLAALAACSVKEHARRFGDRISLQTPDEPVHAETDPELLQVLLSQLLDNACKYSKPGSRVTVTVRTEGEFVTIRVANTGISIGTADRERIFERFYRGAEAQRSAAGTGLGLYLARKIAVAHGGSLVLDENSSGGAAAVFCLRLPALRAKAKTIGDEEPEDRVSYSGGR